MTNTTGTSTGPAGGQPPGGSTEGGRRAALRVAARGVREAGRPLRASVPLADCLIRVEREEGGGLASAVHHPVFARANLA